MEENLELNSEISDNSNISNSEKIEVSKPEQKLNH